MPDGNGLTNGFTLDFDQVGQLDFNGMPRLMGLENNRVLFGAEDRAQMNHHLASGYLTNDQKINMMTADPDIYFNSLFAGYYTLTVRYGHSLL